METQPATVDPKPPAEIEAIRERLSEDHKDFIDRADVVIASCGRMPSEVTDEDMAGKFGDQIKILTAAVKDANGRRTMEKEPFLEGGRAVDGFFKTISEKLETHKREAQKPLAVYERAKADAERRRREEEARKAEAEAAAAAAAAVDSEEALDAAVAAEEVAGKAVVEAGATAADMSRTRGKFGSVSSLRTTWGFEDLDRESLDIEALRHHIPQAALETAVRAFIKAGGRELKGVRIVENTDVVVR